MADFSSINESEQLIAGTKKNDSLACKSNGKDAAAVAGAVIAGVAVVGAAAVGAMQSSLFSKGIGASGTAQADATSAIGSATSGAASSAASAQQGATNAIMQGPGSKAKAMLGAAQGDIKSAQSDAMKLAGEARAGADAQIAEGQAQISGAQNYIAGQMADAKAFAQSGMAEGQTLLKGKMNAALAKAPPKVVGLAKPLAGKKPKLPLPANVPPPAKVVEERVPKPPSNLSIRAPKNASVPTEKIVPEQSTQKAVVVEEEQMKQATLSKEELDKCTNERYTLGSAVKDVKNSWSRLGEELALPPQTKVFQGGIDIQLFIKISDIVSNGWPCSNMGAMTKKTVEEITEKSSNQKVKDLLRGNGERIVGIKQMLSLCTFLINKIEYTGTCEEIKEYGNIIKPGGMLSSAMQYGTEVIVKLLTEVWVSRDSQDTDLESLNFLAKALETMRIYTESYYLSFKMDEGL